MIKKSLTVIPVFTLLISCASNSLLPNNNPSRYSTEQQTQAINKLIQAEALLHACLDQEIRISRIEITAAPDQELWYVESCTGKENAYRVSILNDGKIALQDIRSRRDIEL